MGRSCCPTGARCCSASPRIWDRLAGTWRRSWCSRSHRAIERSLRQGGSDARYLPTGHLVYALRDGVFGAAFDVTRLTIRGGAVPLIQGVQRTIGVSAVASNYALSDQGTLVFVPGVLANRSFVWMHRNGTAEPISVIPAGTVRGRAPLSLRRSSAGDAGRRHLDLRPPLWTKQPCHQRRHQPDGCLEPNRLASGLFVAKSGNLEAWITSSDGSGQPQQLTTLADRSRRLVVARRTNAHPPSPSSRTTDAHSHAVAESVSVRQPEVFLEGDFNSEGANFSPDGRHVAYLSQETGSREIYIRPHQGTGGQVTVSVGGGAEPIWAKNGELFYRSLYGERMFAVPDFATEPTLESRDTGAALSRTFLHPGNWFASSAIRCHELTDNGCSC